MIAFKSKCRWPQYLRDLLSLPQGQVCHWGQGCVDNDFNDWLLYRTVLWRRKWSLWNVFVVNMVLKWLQLLLCNYVSKTLHFKANLKTSHRILLFSLWEFLWWTKTEHSEYLTLWKNAQRHHKSLKDRYIFLRLQWIIIVMLLFKQEAKFQTHLFSFQGGGQMTARNCCI